MHRTQIDILDVTPGQAIGQPIKSICDEEILIPIGDEHFAIIGCEARDSDGYIETEPKNVRFVHRYYKPEDLAKVFDADQMAEFEAERAAHDAKRAEEQRQIEYRTYLQLKAKFDTV